MFIVSNKTSDPEYYIDSEEMLNSDEEKTYADYLDANENAKPEFLGKLAESLNVNKTFNKDEFRNLWAGKTPDGSQSLINIREDHKPATDIVFALPKSLSAYIALAPKEEREKIERVIHESINEIIESEFKQLIKPSCKKDEYKNFDNNQTEMLVAKFTHYENRIVDPHYHIHIELFNFAKFKFQDENKILAIDAEDIVKQQKLLTLKTNALIRSKIQEIGINTEKDIRNGNEHSFRLSGITEKIELQLSSRKKEIERWVKENKLKFVSIEERDKAWQKEEIRRVTADDKKELSFNKILNVFKDKFEKFKFSYDDFLNKNKDELQKKINDNLNKSLEKLDDKIQPEKEFLEKITGLSGTFAKIEFDRQILQTYQDEIQELNLKNTEEINKFLNEKFKEFDEKIKNSDELKQYEFIKIDDNNYTTKKVVQTEVNIVEKAKELRKTECFEQNQFFGGLGNTAEVHYTNTLNELQKDFQFNSGQKEAIKLVSDSRSLNIVIGDAGTGKTTSVIKFANDYYSKLNFQVIGTSTQTNTADQLGKDAGIKITKSFAALITEYENGKLEFNGKPPLIIVDEAGMTSSEHLEKVLDIVKAHGGKLILVGDDKQLASVGAGQGFKNILEDVKDLKKPLVARLSQNMRQKNVVAKEIAESFRDKDINKAINLLKNNDLLHTKKDEKFVLAKLVSDYFQNESENKIVITNTNTDANKLNDLIRANLIKENKLDITKQIAVEVSTDKNDYGKERYFAVGEKIVFKENHRFNKNEKIKNGQFATIKEINSQEMTVEILGEEFTQVQTIKFEDYNKFNHAYAVTTYKSQGQTVKDAFIYTNGNTTSNHTYVEFSRHKNSVNVYMTDEAKEKFVKKAKAEIKKFNPLSFKNFVEASKKPTLERILKQEKKVRYEHKLKQLEKKKKEEEIKKQTDYLSSTRHVELTSDLDCKELIKICNEYNEEAVHDNTKTKYTFAKGFKPSEQTKVDLSYLQKTTNGNVFFGGEHSTKESLTDKNMLENGLTETKESKEINAARNSTSTETTIATGNRAGHPSPFTMAPPKPI